MIYTLYGESIRIVNGNVPLGIAKVHFNSGLELTLEIKWLRADGGHAEIEKHITEANKLN